MRQACRRLMPADVGKDRSASPSEGLSLDGRKWPKLLAKHDYVSLRAVFADALMLCCRRLMKAARRETGYSPLALARPAHQYRNRHAVADETSA